MSQRDREAILSVPVPPRATENSAIFRTFSSHCHHAATNSNTRLALGRGQIRSYILRGNSMQTQKHTAR
jgi:hypothetical protein